MLGELILYWLVVLTNYVCSGVRSAIESAIHVCSCNMASGWRVLLVDASNAFNSLDYVALL